jgi:endonuclease-3 related protein
MHVEGRQILRQLYKALHRAYGPQGWWPGDGAVEIIVGAILTQNTNWRNVERALSNLRDAKLLDWKALRDVPAGRLARLIRPAGYYNVKAKRLKHFVAWLWRQHHGDLRLLRMLPLNQLRSELLGIHGIGPETADSILLYALDRPTFVIDAYTRRLAVRHGLVHGNPDYDKLKRYFEDRMPHSAKLYNEYHALVVAVGKKHCRPVARCEGCPLDGFAHDPQAC